MLGVRGARKLTGGAGSEDWRWHNGIHVNKMSPMYHMGKNDVKTSTTLSRLRKNLDCAQNPMLSWSLPLLGEWPRVPFTARIERAQFHRARSASKKGTWPLPPLLADFSAS